MDQDDAANPVAPEQGGDPVEELAYRLRQQRLTAAFGHFALRSHDVDAILQEATRVCARGLRSELCKIMEYLAHEDQFVVRAGVGWKPGVVGQARTEADAGSPTGYAFRTGEPVISTHPDGETRFRTPKILVEHGVKRAVNVRIMVDGRPFGVLEVDSPDESRFTEADIAFMQGFAGIVGVAVERQEIDERLKAALAHQEVLTHEISHRVKNSLSIVASLLSMQARMAADPQLRRGLEDAHRRVQTIAQVHDRLWRADEVHTIDLAAFMGELCEHLQSAARPGQVLACEFASVTVATDQAVPLGLLVNELVTNAYKYAYPDGTGEVRVSVRLADGGDLRLEVADGGIGLPPDLDATRSASLGMKLVGSLARQLGGRSQWQDAGPGTRFVLDFCPRGRSRGR